MTDFPVKVDRALYDEAAALYAAKVASRATAVYTIGNITFPGLSDLDLLVVTSAHQADNAQFFSVSYRLAERFDPVFLHNPLIVPGEHLDVLAYTTHQRRHLIGGKDVFAGASFVETDEERWCKLLEGYCTYSTFVALVESTQSIRGRRLIAKASSLRFSLRELDALCGTAHAQAYARELDDIRSSYFSRDPAEALAAAWHEFKRMFDEMTRSLREILNLDRNQPIDDFARRVFRGGIRLDRIDAKYLAARSLAIDRYHEELAAMRLPFGQVFFWEAHGDRARLYAQGPVHNKLYRAKYKLERMLDAAKNKEDATTHS
jgi:hypothetical protein